METGPRAKSQIGRRPAKEYAPAVNLLLTAALVLPLLAHAETGLSPRTDSPEAAKDTTVHELKNLDAADDAAQAEVDKWTAENNLNRTKGGGLSDADLQRKITERFEPVLKAYETFVQQQPSDARGHVAYGNFLMARDDERGAQAEWEKALVLDPQNPSMYNSLAGRYSESGPVDKSFTYFTKAIELSPKEPAYYHNFADVLFVRRKQAAIFYGLTEQGVYARSLLLYSNALTLDPLNFNFARDLAQTYYSLKPLPFDRALGAWTNAINIARQEVDLHDSYVHLARVKMLAGRFDEARAQLALVTNAACMQAKTNLLKNIQQRESEAGAAPERSR
jgi:tetratricopeptide (TPR) repeat protein